MEPMTRAPTTEPVTGQPEARSRVARLSAVLREEERVTPLELFFDLVFVLAITQCTALMAHHPTWVGLGKAMLVLALMWWTWVGYAWLTSVLNPEEGVVRIAMFAAMAAVLVAAISSPDAFGGSALLFAGAYAGVRAAHIVLFLAASRDNAQLRRSVLGLAISTAVGVGLIFVAAAFDGPAQGILWVLALALDYVGPYLRGAEGWTLVPGHFAERHSLIVLVALGESIVAIGAGARIGVDAGIVGAAVAGVAVAAGLWWLYFDVVALVAAHHLAEAPEGRIRNEMARDSYSYLHLPMIAGIVLVALGMTKTIGDVGSSLPTVPAVALYGGTILYLLGHLAFRLRNVGTLNKQRLVTAIGLAALVPVALHVPALAAAALLAGVLAMLVAYEAIRFSAARDRVRHELAREPVPS
jgi:low temperature requirement protein LtrA